MDSDKTENTFYAKTMNYNNQIHFPQADGSVIGVGPGILHHHLVDLFELLLNVQQRELCTFRQDRESFPCSIISPYLL
jgi:hypothetical protein